MYLSNIMKYFKLIVVLLAFCFALTLHADVGDFGALDDHNVCRDFDGKKICSEDIERSDVVYIRSTVEFLFNKNIETEPFYQTDRNERLQALEDALLVTSEAMQIDSNSDVALAEASKLYQDLHDRIQSLMNMYFKSSDTILRDSAIDFFNSMYSLIGNIRYPILFSVLNEDAVQSTYSDVVEEALTAKRSS